jgi:hypothetical protein
MKDSVRNTNIKIDDFGTITYTCAICDCVYLRYETTGYERIQSTMLHHAEVGSQKSKQSAAMHDIKEKEYHGFMDNRGNY